MTVQPAGTIGSTAWWGNVPGSTAASDALTQLSHLDQVDRISIGSRGLVSGIAASRGILSAVKLSGERVAAGAAPMSSMGMIGRSLGATVGRSMMIGGVVSTAANFFHAVIGKISPARAAGNVTADLATTAGGAVAATAAAGLVAGAIGAAPGALLAGATFLAGTAAFVGVEALLRVTGVHQGISDGATGLVNRIIDHFRRRVGPGGV